MSDGALEDLVNHHSRMAAKLQDADDQLLEAVSGAAGFGLGREFGNGIGEIRESEQALAKSLAAFQEKIRAAARKYRFMETDAEADMRDISRARWDG